MISPIEIKFDSFQLTDEQFFQLCQDNRDLRFERNAHGDLTIMPPTGGKTVIEISKLLINCKHGVVRII